VHWRFAGGDLRLYAQFGETSRTPTIGAGESIIWSSGRKSEDGLELAPWTGLFTLEARHGGA
jgi:hypothetical protein